MIPCGKLDQPCVNTTLDIGCEKMQSSTYITTTCDICKNCKFSKNYYGTITVYNNKSEAAKNTEKNLKIKNWKKEKYYE